MIGKHDEYVICNEFGQILFLHMQNLVILLNKN